MRLCADALLIVACLSGAALGQDACKSAGFTGEQSCTDCEQLVEYTGDAELGNDCQACCQNVEHLQASKTKYKTATLEVCEHRLRDFPQIEGFINERAHTYSALSISFRFASFPKLILRSGKQRESIRIDHWKGENIEEYLRDRLEQAV